jgi:hypothetical protein
MSERGDIWLSRGFSVTCILSAFIGAVTVGMLLGEPDFVIMLFGAVGGMIVGAVFLLRCHRRYPPSGLTARNHDLAGKVLGICVYGIAAFWCSHLRASRSPRPHRRCRTARPDLCERRPSRLVATAEDRLNISR